MICGFTGCQTSNEEGYARCLQCGASRTARRFGAGTPVAAPSVADAVPVARVPAPAPTPRQSEASSRPQRAEAQLDRRVVRCALGRLLVAFGLVLALLAQFLRWLSFKWKWLNLYCWACCCQQALRYRPSWLLRCMYYASCWPVCLSRCRG